MITIGVIGASGQVGTEVCLYLKTYSKVRPVALVRTSISGALLRRLGIEVRLGTFETSSESRNLLRDCDLVVDFSAPAGEVNDTKAHYERHVRQAVACAPEGARYVFVSTIDAFGMSAKFDRAKHYFLPHSIYAHTKRFAEQLACQIGRQYRRDVYIFRLGHVHGELQRVSHETMELVRKNYRCFQYPDTPSYTIFCHSIAEGLINVAQGREAAGTYTLVSEPAWSWREVLEHYADPLRFPQVELLPPNPVSLGKRLHASVRSWMGELTHSYKDTLRANVLHRFPVFERKFQAEFHTKKANREVQTYDDLLIYRPTRIHEGVIPGCRLPSITDSRVTMRVKADQVRAYLDELRSRTGIVPATNSDQV